MKAFAELYAALDETTRTGEKVDALARYFAAVPAEDAAWAVHFLIGRRPKRLVGARRLAEWAMEATGTPEWLFAECYDSVGDLAESISLLLPPSETSSDLPLREWVARLMALRGEDEAAQRGDVMRAWAELDGAQAYVWNKLITGSFRVGVSQKLVVRALAQVSGVDENTIAHRLMGAWEPGPDLLARLLSAETGDADVSRPYPFFLAYALEEEPDALGEAPEWQTEWKWDGIRAQVIRRAGSTFHFHQPPLRRPTPYGASRRLSISPSACFVRASRYACRTSSQSPAGTTGEGRKRPALGVRASSSSSRSRRHSSGRGRRSSPPASSRS